VAMESGCEKGVCKMISIPRVQSGEQSTISFQPVSNGDDGWSAFFARRMTPDWLNTKAKLVGDYAEARESGYEKPLCRAFPYLAR
jgi:hypothetical protein